MNRSQKICQSRHKVNAEFWLSTAGQRGSLGSGVSCPRAREKGLADPSPTENQDKRGKRQQILGDKMTGQQGTDL